MFPPILSNQLLSVPFQGSDSCFFLRQFIFIYLLAVQGLHWGQRCYSLIASHCGGFSCCGTRALQHAGSAVAVHQLSSPMVCGILVPGPGIEPLTPALAIGFLTTEPARKSLIVFE